jgi:hypothetical protein
VLTFSDKSSMTLTEPKRLLTFTSSISAISRSCVCQTTLADTNHKSRFERLYIPFRAASLR